MSNVFSLHRQKHPINHLVRIGHTGHEILENLYTAGRAPISHAVVDAGHSLRQKELIATLSTGGAEIILESCTGHWWVVRETNLPTPAGYVSIQIKGRNIYGGPQCKIARNL